MMEFGGNLTMLKIHDKQILHIIKALLDIFRLQSVTVAEMQQLQHV